MVIGWVPAKGGDVMGSASCLAVLTAVADNRPLSRLDPQAQDAAESVPTFEPDTLNKPESGNGVRVLRWEAVTSNSPAVNGRPTTEHSR